MNKINLELNDSFISMEEIKLLKKLLSRVSYKYQGSEVRERLSETEIENIEKSFHIINNLRAELIEEGYNETSLIKE